MAKKKGKKRGIGNIRGISDVIAQSVKGGAQTAYGPAIHDQRKVIKQTQAQKKVINNAYRAYDRQLSELQAADAARVDATRASQMDAVQALEGVGSQVTERAAAEAARRAVLFGQGDSVEEGIRALGGGASAAREAQALTSDAAVADLGLAQYTDLSRRRGTGRRDRIRAQEERRDVVREERSDLQQLLKEKGGFMADKAWERIQEEEQNKIARAGLRLDRRGQNLDAQQAKDALAVDVWETLQENKGGGKDGGGASGGGGLSPSEREEYRRYENQLKATIDYYEKAIKNGKEPGKAASIARKKAGTERWMSLIAKQVISQGGLNARGRHLLKGKLPPGAPIPKFLR